MTHSRPLIIIIGSSLILDRETTTKGLLGTISGVIFLGKISFGRLVLEFCGDKKRFFLYRNGFETTTSLLLCLDESGFFGVFF